MKLLDLVRRHRNAVRIQAEIVEHGVQQVGGGAGFDFFRVVIQPEIGEL
jgi:hypothetical protein